MMKSSMTLLAVAGAITMAGCAKKVAKPQPTPTPAAAPAAESKANYIVKRGDSLWTIADKKSTLGDAFRWPLLFKANRDQITDPDLIEVKQDLSYKKEYSKAEIDEAVQKAKDTPPFVPHAAPRKTLPVKY